MDLRPTLERQTASSHRGAVRVSVVGCGVAAFLMLTGCVPSPDTGGSPPSSDSMSTREAVPPAPSPGDLCTLLGLDLIEQAVPDAIPGAQDGDETQWSGSSSSTTGTTCHRETDDPEGGDTDTLGTLVAELSRFGSRTAFNSERAPADLSPAEAAAASFTELCASLSQSPEAVNGIGQGACFIDPGPRIASREIYLFAHQDGDLVELKYVYGDRRTAEVGGPDGQRMESILRDAATRIFSQLG